MRQLNKNKIIAALLIWAAFCLGPAEALTKFANDPTFLSIGARVLGMGGSFTGVADDTSAIYLNPAGVDRVDDWQLSSMSGKYLNIFDYSQFSALYPTDYGTFALGYGGSNIEFRFPSSEVIIIGDEIRIVPTGEVSGKYVNTALLFTYANHFNPNFRNLNDIHLGASLKLLSQDLAATGITRNTASGMELNLGALYQVNNEWKLGLSVINALPASLGGKITWSSTLTETLPALLKTGIAYKPRKELSFSLDQDHYLTRRDAPDLLHFGTEWFPANNVTVRGGLDQSQAVDAAGAPSVSNDLTMGLGFLFNGFRFDYAYHAYNNIAGNATHYFSLTYGVWPEKLAEKRQDEYFLINSPADRSLLFDEAVLLQGKVIDRRVRSIEVGGKKVKVARDGVFEEELILQIGLNKIKLEAYGDKGKLLKKVTWKIVRLPTFWDVKTDHWSRLQIGQLAVLDIIRGYPNGSYKPDDMIIRSEIVALLMRSLGTEETKVSGIFSDVNRRHWAARYIEEASNLGIVEGYTDGTFQPAKAISRAEGATIIARFDKLPNVRLLESPYPDVPGRHWAARAITQLKENGFLDFITDKEFHWQEPLSRGEVAYMLSKSQYVKDKFEKLFND